jgi:hypothetical protein
LPFFAFFFFAMRWFLLAPVDLSLALIHVTCRYNTRDATPQIANDDE